MKRKKGKREKRAPKTAFLQRKYAIEVCESPSCQLTHDSVENKDSDDEDVEYKGDLGIPEVDDCATGSFCSTCAIPPRVAGGLWSAGVGCDACYFPFGVIRFRRRG